nr:carboxypeptidase-like regulatory domain-containing protein [Granulicella aggregans]
MAILRSWPTAHRGHSVQIRFNQLGTTLILLTGVAVCLPAAAQVSPAAAVTGVVRDVQGVAQAGALVQVMAAGLDVPRTTFTDIHGRYSIANLIPGKYAVQASAALFISTSKDNLQLHPGKWSVVNLTLATLFDTSAWLPAERRKSDEPGDEWKWTLRSSANRPMLRMADDETGEATSVLTSSSATETRRDSTQARATFTSGDGGFGHGGTHSVLAQGRELADGSELMLRMDVGTPTEPAGVGPSTEVEVGFGRKLGYGGAVRTVVSYQGHPELLSSGGTTNGIGVTTFQMASAEQIALGDTVKIEVGSEVYAVKAVGTAMGADPFFRVAVQPSENWTVGYRMATARELQSFGDLDAVERDLPVTVCAGSHMETEHGRHQEVSVSRKLGHGVAEVTYYHDAMDHPAVAGRSVLPDGEPVLQSLGASGFGVLQDPSTASFRFLASGYSAGGMNLMVSEPLGPGLWAALEYSTGSALSGRKVADGMSLAEASDQLYLASGQSATFAVRGRLIRSGTKLRAAYRWQPTGLVTAIDPYRAFSDQAYLSLAVRQPIHMGRLLPPGLEGTLNVTNLLAQGYKPFLSSDGSTLVLAQSPRTLEAGLSVTF